MASNSASGYLVLNLSAKTFKNVVGRSNDDGSEPFYEVSTNEGVLVAKSDANGGPLRVSIDDLCGGNLEKPIFITYYDKDEFGFQRIIGNIETTAKSLMEVANTGSRSPSQSPEGHITPAATLEEKEFSDPGTASMNAALIEPPDSDAIRPRANLFTRLFGDENVAQNQYTGTDPATPEKNDQEEEDEDEDDGLDEELVKLTQELDEARKDVEEQTFRMGAAELEDALVDTVSDVSSPLDYLTRYEEMVRMHTDAEEATIAHLQTVLNRIYSVQEEEENHNDVLTFDAMARVLQEGREEIWSTDAQLVLMLAALTSDVNSTREGSDHEDNRGLLLAEFVQCYHTVVNGMQALRTLPKEDDEFDDMDRRRIKDRTLTMIKNFGEEKDDYTAQGDGFSSTEESSEGEKVTKWTNDKLWILVGCILFSFLLGGVVRAFFFPSKLPSGPASVQHMTPRSILNTPTGTMLQSQITSLKSDLASAKNDTATVKVTAKKQRDLEFSEWKKEKLELIAKEKKCISELEALENAKRQELANMQKDLRKIEKEKTQMKLTMDSSSGREEKGRAMLAQSRREFDSSASALAEARRNAEAAEKTIIKQQQQMDQIRKELYLAHRSLSAKQSEMSNSRRQGIWKRVRGVLLTGLLVLLIPVVWNVAAIFWASATANMAPPAVFATTSFNAGAASGAVTGATSSISPAGLAAIGAAAAKGAGKEKWWWKLAIPAKTGKNGKDWWWKFAIDLPGSKKKGLSLLDKIIKP